jgi:hypothetical protein
LGTAIAHAAPSLEMVLDLAKQLSPADQLRLVGRVIPDLERKLEDDPEKPLTSLCGALAHLGPAPSAEEIEEARREMWRNFPRDDV